MKTLNIEFFHDVICSFCYPMSFRMRTLQGLFPNINILHRSFALVMKEDDFSSMFGSREQAKNAILAHWESANQNDDLHRFNIEGMRKQSFAFPTSLKPLRACKAAYYVGEESAYWDVFDSLQTAFFSESKNVDVDDVIFDAIRCSGVDFVKWNSFFNSETVRLAIDKDLELAQNYNIRSVPTLVLNGKQLVSGAVALSELVKIVEDSGLKRINPLQQDDACARNSSS